ncbi:hypothetical protein PPERSA_00413 [Pseudocohnilembus persalinus]|uniref:Transmembrane protein n=1 Tax=Pseudocohnilembus persalinus TaxID=266149 RepID=A0A0V0QZE3_PSEPJ|nr:hypothetical protein PPERSA_00413 [Pseudocohnilembus persalinus]|eukprot:KRX07256.1 hypothetical protein PPERSA_00413 [Pseudocohnilembus persalinus]
MGSKSEKKIQKQAQELTRYYTTVFLIISAIFLVSHFFTGDLFTFKVILQFIFLTLVNLFCCKQIIKQINNGLSSEYYSTYLDIFVLNSFVEFTTCFYSFFWYFYLIIPGYLVYKFGGYCFNKTKNLEYEEDPKNQLSKTQQKKQKKMEKQGQQPIYKKM